MINVIVLLSVQNSAARLTFKHYSFIILKELEVRESKQH